MVLFQTKENLRSIYNEVFGERTDHPLIVRFLAFLVDFGLFLITGPIIYVGLDAIEKHSTLNQLIISITLLTVYLTLGNSKIFKGQTIGKKLLRIRTVDKEGSYLKVIKSLVRSLPIVLLLNSYQIMFFIITEQDNFIHFRILRFNNHSFWDNLFPIIKTQPTRTS